MPNLDFSNINIDDIKSIKESNPTTKLDFSKVDISDIKNIKQQMPVFTGKLPELNYDNSDNATYSQFQSKQQELKNILPKTDDYSNWLKNQDKKQPTQESVKEKEDETLLKSSQVSLNVSDESLQREGEYGVNRSTYGNTQRVVNNAQQSKVLLNDPNADGDLLKEDITNRIKSLEDSKKQLENKNKTREKEINDIFLRGDYTIDEQASLTKELQNLQDSYNKTVAGLNETYVNLKKIYTTPEQRVKYNTLLKLVKENPNALNTITQEQWDKAVSDYGTTLTYLGEPENEATYLQAQVLNQLNTSNRIAYEAMKSGSAFSGIIRGAKGGTDKKVFQQVDRYGEYAMLDDISKYLEDKGDELKAKYEEINKDRDLVKTKEDVEEFNNRLKELEPEAKQLEALQDNLKSKAENIDIKYENLKKYEDYQKHINYLDELEGHNRGIGVAFGEYIDNFPITVSTGIKQLLTKLEDKDSQDLSSFENLTNYKWNTVQIPSYYKDTPVIEKSDTSPIGYKINKSAWYNIGRVSVESLALAGMAALSGGTSLAAQAGLTSLRGVLSGMGAASSIVIPTMIMTSSQASLDYLEQGIKPSLANDMGLITGFIEGLTEVINPIELTAPLRLTTLANRFSNNAAYRITLNNVFKQVTGKTPSKELVKLLTTSLKEGGIDFLKQTRNEVLEEEIGLFLNGLKNQSYKEKILGFQPSPDEEVNLTNILMTAANTAITMPLLGAMGAGATVYQNRNSALPTAKFIVGQNSQLYLDRLEEDYKNKLIPKEVYEAAKTEIPRLQGLYKANEFTIANLPNEDKQISYFQLVDEQQELVKKLAVTPENEEMSKKVDTINSQIASLQREALINSAKTPEEKYKVAEKLMLEGIEKLYTPEFLKTANLEAVKKDLQKRYDYIKSPKVLEKANAILQQIQDLENKEEQKTEITKQDEKYLQSKKEETLLNSILDKVKQEEIPELSEEESAYFDQNEELVTQKIQELQQEQFESKESLEGAFGKQEEIPVSDIEAKKAELNKQINIQEEHLFRLRDVVDKYESNSPEWNEAVLHYNSEELKLKDLKEQLIQVNKNSPLVKKEKLQETKPTVKEKVIEETKVNVETNLTPEQERQLLDQTEEDVTKANSTSMSFIAKLTKIEEEENIPETGFIEKLLLTAWDKIAYQARKFVKKGQNLDDSLNSEYEFLNSPEIKEGHELIFKLSPKNEFLADSKRQFEENKDGLLQLGVLTEDEYLSVLNDNDNFIQIDVTDKEGRNFGSLHTIDYIREDRVVSQLNEDQDYGKNLRDNLYTLIQQRKEILKQLKQSKQPKAVITNKTIGTLSIKADKQYIDLKEAIKNKEVVETLQVVLKPNDVVKGNKATVNSTILGNMAGQVIVLLPTPQGNNFALGLKKKTLGSELAHSVINAIKFYKEYKEALISGNVQRLQELDEIATQIIDKTGAKYDIRDFNGLRDYISLFVYNNAKTSTFTSPDNRVVKKDIPFIDFDTNNESITFSNKRFFASKEANEELTSIAKLKEVGITRQFLFDKEGKAIPLTNFFTEFEKFLSERSINIKPDLLQSEEAFELPLLSDDYQFIDNSRAKSTNYKEFVINNTETNVLESKITSSSNKQEYSYFQQPTISFELEKPKKTKKTTKTEKDIVSTESLIQLAADKYNTTVDKIITNKRLQSTAKRLTGEKYLAKMNNEQKAEMLKYFNFIKSRKEIKEEKQQAIEEQRTQNKEKIDNAALQFKIDRTTVIWNSKTEKFESYNSKFDKKESSLKSVKLSNKPNVLNIWWESLVSEETKDKIVEFKYNLLDLLSKTNDIIDIEPEITPELFLIKMLRKTKFSLNDKLDLTDVSDKWFKKDEKSINELAKELLDDEIYSEGMFANFDEQELEQAIKDIISNYPKGITNEDIEKADYENNTNAIDVLSLQEEFSNKFGVDLEIALAKLYEQIENYENERRIKKENEEEDINQESSDIQETFGEIEEELDEFSFYNEEKPKITFGKIENYPNLANIFNSLTEEEKKNIGNLGEFISNYEQTGLPITEENLIEELKCRKNK